MRGPETAAAAGDWYLVQVRPNGLRTAERNLRRQAFEVFCPRETVTLRRGSGRTERERPLYPGYLFVAVTSEGAPWRSINGTYGVNRLVTFGDGMPRPLPGGLVPALRARCDGAGLLLPADRLAPGDRVRVLRGPFAEVVSRVESLSPDERVWILLDLMGRETRVSVARDALVPAGQALA